jgi:hypothetical protein
MIVDHLGEEQIGLEIQMEAIKTLASGEVKTPDKEGKP